MLNLKCTRLLAKNIKYNRVYTDRCIHECFYVHLVPPPSVYIEEKLSSDICVRECVIVPRIETRDTGIESTSQFQKNFSWEIEATRECCICSLFALSLLWVHTVYQETRSRTADKKYKTFATCHQKIIKFIINPRENYNKYLLER